MNELEDSIEASLTSLSATNSQEFYSELK